MSPKFSKGDRINVKLGFNTEIKPGTIEYLRNDKWEQKNNHPDNNYYYSINYDDNTSDVYVHESYINLLEVKDVVKEEEKQPPKFKIGDKVTRILPFFTNDPVAKLTCNKTGTIKAIERCICTCNNRCNFTMYLVLFDFTTEEVEEEELDNQECIYIRDNQLEKAKNVIYQNVNKLHYIERATSTYLVNF